MVEFFDKNYAFFDLHFHDAKKTWKKKNENTGQIDYPIMYFIYLFIFFLIF